MSLYNDLERVSQALEGVSENYLLDLDHTLDSFSSLGPALSRCTVPSQCLVFLVREVETRNRESFKQRIYGRYRKLLPNRDTVEIQKWRKEWESKKISSNPTSTNE